MKLKHISIIFFLFLNITIFGQNDSLLNLLKTENTDSTKVNIYIQLSEIQDDIDTSLVFAEKALEIAEFSEDGKLIAKSNFNIGEIYNNLGFQEKAVSYFGVAEKYYKKNNLKKELINIYNKTGYTFEVSGDYKLAGEYYLKAYSIVEEVGSDVDKARILNSLGSVYFAQKNYDGALEYWKKALKIVEKIDYKLGISSILSNIGNVYLENKNYDATLSFYNRSLKISEEISDSAGIGVRLNNLGNLFLEKEELPKALEYYEKALKIKKAMNDYYSVTSTLYNIATIYEKQENLNSALKTINEALDIAIENDYKSLQVDLYNEKAFIYEKSKKFEKALISYYSYDSLRKEIYSKEIAEAYSQNEKRYNYDKKEKENQLYRTEQKAKEEKQRNYVIGLIIGVIFLIIIAITILRGYRQKKQANELLEVQKNEILEKNEELSQLNEEVIQQRDEIEAQRNKVFEQKDELEDIHKEITNSIAYAKRIQTSTLPRIELLKDVFPDSFVLLRPKDVVSGDFYWFASVENHTIITVADCTGHGVPGAFMSMLGMSLLKEIVVKEYITEPSVILRKLRKEIINALQQKGVSGEQKDGMDMALISYNHDTKQLKYAGANNPLYIVSSREIQCETAEIKVVESENCSKKLYEFKADKMPIAIYVKMDRFISHEITLEEGDIIYISSDGFPDQFGGPKGKKYKYKPFKQLLLDNSKNKMDGQKEILNSTIVNWMGNTTEQIDDICIMGLKC
jgi:serine phosphatase RsbU (regulator of sigma subunit)